MRKVKEGGRKEGGVEGVCLVRARVERGEMRG